MGEAPKGHITALCLINTHISFKKRKLNKAEVYYSSGLGESSLDHRRREEFPAIFISKRNILSKIGGLYKDE